MKGKQQDFRTEKYIRYGIRKYSFGAASVAIAAGLMFLGNGAVSATEVQGSETALTAISPLEEEKQNSADVKSKEAQAEIEKPESKVVKANKVNKTSLEASVATLESKLSGASYAESSVVNSAKEVLAAAKTTLAKADVSQAEIDDQVAIVSALNIVVSESDKVGLLS